MRLIDVYTMETTATITTQGVSIGHNSPCSPLQHITQRLAPSSQFT